MTTVIIEAFTAEELKTKIDALGATTIHIVERTHQKPKYIVVYTP